VENREVYLLQNLWIGSLAVGDRERGGKGWREASWIILRDKQRRSNFFFPVMTTHPGYGADNEVKSSRTGRRRILGLRCGLGFLRDGEHKGILEIKRNRETSGGRYARLQARIFKALQNEEFIQ